MVTINSINISNSGNFVLFGGINVLESRDLALRACEEYVRVTSKLVVSQFEFAGFSVV